jgi:hypothetical protein
VAHDPESENSSVSAPEEPSRDAVLTSLRSGIKTLEGDIYALKCRVGDFYWKRFAQTGKFDPEVRAILGRIRSKIDNITETELEIQIIEDGEGQPLQPPIELQLDRVVCRSCGMTNAPASKYCSSCGMPLGEEAS